MPLTFTQRKTAIIGDLKVAIYTVAFDTSYAANGEPLVPATLGFDVFYFAKAQAPAGYHVAYDYTNQTLRAYRINIAATAGGDIVAGADNTIVQNVAMTGVEVSGAGGAFQANLGEVTTAADMSTDLAAVRLIVYGK